MQCDQLLLINRTPKKKVGDNEKHEDICQLDMQNSGVDSVHCLCLWYTSRFPHFRLDLSCNGLQKLIIIQQVGLRPRLAHDSFLFSLVI